MNNRWVFLVSCQRSPCTRIASLHQLNSRRLKSLHTAVGFYVLNSLYFERTEGQHFITILSKELCPLTEDEVSELLAAFFSVCEWVQIHYLWRPNLKDEGDNFLIELAVAGNAESIITNNLKDLRNAELQFDGLKVLAPEDYLRGV